MLGYLNYVKGMDNLTAVRTLRVLRPLRTINSVPGMKIIIASLLSAVSYLVDVLTLFMGLIFVYGAPSLPLPLRAHHKSHAHARLHSKKASELMPPSNPAACRDPGRAVVWWEVLPAMLSRGERC